jgi:hypothetical protein
MATGVAFEIRLSASIEAGLRATMLSRIATLRTIPWIVRVAGILADPFGMAAPEAMVFPRVPVVWAFVSRHCQTPGVDW